MKTQDIPERIRVRLGNRIQEARKKAGLTQIEVAKALGISQSLISDWEKGNVIPLATNIYQLTQLFGISPLLLNPFEELAEAGSGTNKEEMPLDIHQELEKVWQAIQRLEARTVSRQ